MAKPYITDSKFPYGATQSPPEVVCIPEGYTFYRLKIRCDSFWKIYLKANGRFEQWEVDWHDREKNQVKPAWPTAQNIRTKK